MTKPNCYDHIDELTWARMATWVDGEGCITILASGYARKGRYNDIRIHVAQGDIRLMHWLKGYFGGSVTEHKRTRESTSFKSLRRMYGWYIGGRRAAEILRHICPFLIVKPEQADLALAYRDTMTTSTKALDQETLELRLALKQKLQHIKRNPPDQELVQ